jgi:hypothetical protein
MRKIIAGILLMSLPISAMAGGTIVRGGVGGASRVQRPGVQTEVIAECQSAPQLRGDVGVIAEFKVTVTEKIREFGSYYEASFTRGRTGETAAVFRGNLTEKNSIVMSRVDDPFRAGFSSIFELDKTSKIGTLTSTRDFGPSKVLLFQCH